MLKKIERYFWVGYLLILIFTVTMCGGCKSIPAPRFEEEAKFHKRLEDDGYIKVTVFNLKTGKAKVRIVEY